MHNKLYEDSHNGQVLHYQRVTVDRSFTFTTTFTCGDVILYGGETYPTVQIGTQCWFQKNLNIGTMINGNANQTNNGIIEKYCYNNLAASCITYGGLYQWNEAMQYVTTSRAKEYVQLAGIYLLKQSFKH